MTWLNNSRTPHWWLLAWPLFVLAALAPAPAGAQAVRVTEIEIRGNQRINREAILTVISTKVDDEASAERLERDRLAIEGLGWFRLVTLAIQRLPGGGARVIFVVTEYPQVQQLDLTGSTVFTDEQLRGLLKTKTGQIFNRVDWEADLNAINKLYADRGYQIRILYNTDQPDFLDRGVLKTEVQELKVGSLTLRWPKRQIKDKQGNVTREEEQHKTKDYVVLRELNQRPGALYNVQQLQRDYRALSGLGFFETINPVVEVAENLTASITWELTEKRTGQVSVGAGYSPRQQLVGRAELSDQNFRGKGQGVSISGEIGSFGGDGAPSVELQFFEPWLTSTRTSMNVELYNKLVYRFSRSLGGSSFNNEDRYFERRFGGTISFGRPFEWPVTLGLRYDDVQTGDLPRRRRTGTPLFPDQDGTVISGSASRVWNTRDYAQNPTEGSLIRFLTELGHASLNEDTKASFTSSVFSKNVIDLRKYIRVRGIKATKEPEREQESQKVPVIALRLMAGTVAGDVPFFEQFFVGGAESLRGYLEDRFWGKSMYLASIEYRRPLFSKIVGVLFADIGDAFGADSAFRKGSALSSDFEQHSGLRPFAAVGLGLRVSTPIGPIRLDFGYGEEGGRTHFSIGHAF